MTRAGENEPCAPWSALAAFVPRCVGDGLPSAPSDHFRYLVVADIGNRLVLAQSVDDPGERPFGLILALVVLADFDPVAIAGDIDGHRRRKQGSALRDLGARRLFDFSLYRFRRSAACLARRSVKPTTSHFEIEMEVGRARGFIDGHGWASTRDALMKAARSLGSKRKDCRFVPRPMSMAFRRPALTSSIRVRWHTLSRCAAAGVKSIIWNIASVTARPWRGGQP